VRCEQDFVTAPSVKSIIVGMDEMHSNECCKSPYKKFSYYAFCLRFRVYMKSPPSPGKLSKVVMSGKFVMEEVLFKIITRMKKLWLRRSSFTYTTHHARLKICEVMELLMQPIKLTT
jgi:hypothetical protein